MEEKYIQVLRSNGYVKKDYGYFKITENNTHWVTLLSENCLQLYAYFTEDSEMEDVYNTKTLQYLTVEELQTLISIFLKSHA